MSKRIYDSNLVIGNLIHTRIPWFHTKASQKFFLHNILMYFCNVKTKTEEKMKKILTILMVMSINLSAFAGTTTRTKSSNKSEQVNVPANIIIKQTITFMNGKSITVFYEKKGEKCSLYSKSDLSKYGAGDLLNIKSTNFERTNSVEGKCYANKTVSALIAMAREYIK